MMSTPLSTVLFSTHTPLFETSLPSILLEEVVKAGVLHSRTTLPLSLSPLSLTTSAGVTCLAETAKTGSTNLTVVSTANGISNHSSTPGVPGPLKSGAEGVVTVIATLRAAESVTASRHASKSDK